MKTEIRKIKTTKGLKDYTYLGCPLTKNKTAWCYRICQTDSEGHGFCGRVAPHSLKSTIQMEIEKYNRKVINQHCKKLENMYLKKQNSSLLNIGINISESEVEIVIPVNPQICYFDGSIHSSFSSKLLQEAAELAVNSKISDTFIITENFNFHLSNTIASEVLITRARFLHKSGNQYLAEALIVDSERTEIARGNGVFVKTNIPLDSDVNYG
jgi:acyl-coenzyme A thioesterase PaaI-like protein